MLISRYRDEPDQQTVCPLARATADLCLPLYYDLWPPHLAGPQLCDDLWPEFLDERNKIRGLEITEPKYCNIAKQDLNIYKKSILTSSNTVYFLLFWSCLFCLRGRVPPLPWDFLHYFTMILQRIRIIVVDAGFEPRTSAPEVWCATNEPLHLLLLSSCYSLSLPSKSF